MPLISLHAITSALPDGRVLFNAIDLTFGLERTGIVGRNGVGKSTLLHIIAGTSMPTEGSVHREGTLRLLREVTAVQDGGTIADAFSSREGLERLRKVLSGNGTAEDISAADWTLDERLQAALQAAGLEGFEPECLQSELSGGQRTRLALAALTFDTPDMILLDEPTNNLDRQGRALVSDLLENWKGGAIVVSHDRELLGHMDRIVELSAVGHRVYGGNWDHYRTQKEVDQAAAERALDAAKTHAETVKRQAQLTRERQERRASAGKRSRARGDAPKILLDARKQRSQATAAHNDAIASRLDAKATRLVEEAQAGQERLRKLSVRVESAEVASRRTLLQLDHVTAGYDAARPVLQDFSLAIVGPERVGLTGPNGSGKSTLLRVATGELTPFSGTVRQGGAIALLDQHAALLDRDATLLENFRNLNPGLGDNDCRAALARFLFRAEAAQKRVSTLSGGEILRAALACVTGGDLPPALLILDEPTNHLDLESIGAMECGLNAYAGALLVVSHDEALLAAIGIERRIVLG